MNAIGIMTTIAAVIAAFGLGFSLHKKTLAKDDPTYFDKRVLRVWAILVFTITAISIFAQASS